MACCRFAFFSNAKPRLTFARWSAIHTHPFLSQQLPFPLTQVGEFQRTISKSVSRSGIGLHSGDIASVTLLPAAGGEGRYFVQRSKDVEKEVRVSAFISSVTETNLSTCIGEGAARVRTIEHLLSALEGLGVDNCRIEIEGGNEVPLLDGSAKIWVDAILEAGLSPAIDDGGNKVPRKVFVLDKPLHVSNGDSFVAAFPSPQLRITYGIDFGQVPAIGTQWFSLCLGSGSVYENEVAPARTFGIFEQIPQLQAAGLIKGGSTDNAIICSIKDGWLNPPLRFSNEPCRHKLLDLVGDIALCAQNGDPGLPVAHIIAFKASHLLHAKFGDALLNAMESKRCS